MSFIEAFAKLHEALEAVDSPERDVEITVGRELFDVMEREIASLSHDREPTGKAGELWFFNIRVVKKSDALIGGGDRCR